MPWMAESMVIYVREQRFFGDSIIDTLASWVGQIYYQVPFFGLVVFGDDPESADVCIRDS